MSDHGEHGPTRRETVAIGAAMVGAAVLAQPAGAQERAGSGRTVTGLVYEDRTATGTGTRGSGAAGIADVLVSNGREVVRTDAQGRYTLPIDDEGVVFVVKPSGYALPTDDNNLPRFSYVHQPNGSPAGMRYAGLAPTGALPPSVDFGLRRSEEPAAFEVVLLTDPQPESSVELDFVRDVILTGMVGTGAAFGMTTGDIMFDDLSLYGRYNRMIGRIGVPWFHIGGNHDLNFEARDSHYARETFKRVYGAPYYAFNYGQALFLMLDNVRYLGADPTRDKGAGRYEGRIGERQLAFVEAVLRETPRDRLVVVALHIPLHNDLTDIPGDTTADRVQLLRLLGDRPSLSIAGHTHTTEHHYLGADGKPADSGHHHHVMTAGSGSWWSGPFDRRGIAAADSRDGTPNGYHVLSVDGARYTTRYVPANEPAERQMRIMLESQFHADDPVAAREIRVSQLLGSPIAAESAGATDLVVNVFDGGPRTRVEARIGRRPPLPLARTRRPDPFVEQIFARNAATKKSWIKAEPSSHVWSMRLPSDLEPGTHRVDVQAIDEYGRPHADHLVLEVTGSAAEGTKRI